MKGEKEKKLRKSHRKPSLISAMIRGFGWSLFGLGFHQFISAIVLQSLLPLCQKWVISYFDSNSNINKQSKNEVLYYTAALIIVLFLNSVFLHHTFHYGQDIGMRLRVGCSTLIYRKVRLKYMYIYIYSRIVQIIFRNQLTGWKAEPTDHLVSRQDREDT